MKILLFVFFTSLCSFTSYCQIPLAYYEFITKGDSLYNVKDFEQAALAYSSAFNVNKGLGAPNVRYKAACCWALTGQADSAFFNLNRIANAGYFDDLSNLTTEPAFVSLRKYASWQDLVKKLEDNAAAHPALLYPRLADSLKEVLLNDQKYRNQFESVKASRGYNSAEFRELDFQMRQTDSINISFVSSILDRFGWLGIPDVGVQGNTTIFLVIQHSNISLQKKYLPLLQIAYKNGKAPGSHLALLQDRIAVAEGNKQVYGSQLAYNEYTKKYYVLPVENAGDLDVKRASMGLEPMADYIKRWGLAWDPASR